MAVDKSLISGSTTLLILSLLEEKDMYGYEMIDTLKGKSNNVFEPYIRYCILWKKRDGLPYMSRRPAER